VGKDKIEYVGNECADDRDNVDMCSYEAEKRNYQGQAYGCSKGPGQSSNKVVEDDLFKGKLLAALFVFLRHRFIIPRKILRDARIM
jgi:hypothetical protein